MFPGTHAASSPDKPALIMGRSGEIVSYGELEERSCRLAQLLWAAGLRPGGHLAIFMENHPRYPEVYWAAFRSGLYLTTVSRHLSAEEAAYIIDDCGAEALVTSRRAGGRRSPLAAPDPEMPAAADGRRSGARATSAYEDAIASHPAETAGDAADGRHDALQLRHHRPAEGHQAPALRPQRRGGGAGDPVPRRRSSASARTPSTCLRLRSTTRRRWASRWVCLAEGATVVMMEEFDPREALRCIESLSLQPQPVGPHHVHAHAEAPRRGAGALRRLEPRGRHPRRRPLSRSGEGADDRVVGADPHGVLRRHRAQRPDLHRLPGLARAPGLGGARGDRKHSHLRRGGGGDAHWRGRNHLLRARRDALRVPQRAREDEGCPASGAPELVDASATWATSTRRDTSTSPTARPS